MPGTLLLLGIVRSTLGFPFRSHVLYSEGAKCAWHRTVTTTRGDVTYHGPGQLVGYPILHGVKPDCGCWIDALEETLIRAVATVGVEAGRDTRNRGVWVGNAKLAALGIRVSRQVTMHGFALNVSPRMADYSGIVACGLQDADVTSLALLLDETPDMSDVKRRVETSFREVFEYGEET